MANVTTNEWIEWAAYNLAQGISATDVKSELMKGGLSPEESSGVIQQVRANPVFAAATQIARKFKLASLMNEALLELESQVRDFTRLPRVSNLSSADFHRYYYSVNRPVIIEDVVPRWPATSRWNLDFFRREFGTALVTYQSGRSPTDHRDSFVDHTIEAPFSQFLDAVETSDSNGSKPYLIAHDHLFEKAPFRPLLNDITFDSRYFDPQEVIGRCFFWLGPAGSTTPMHRDLGNVYLAQISGRKLFRMVPSQQLHLIYNEVGYHSEVDFDNLNLEKFPLLKDAYIAEEVVGPGDLLFIPVGWWHFVKSLDVTISVTGNNFAFPNKLRPIFD